MSGNITPTADATTHTATANTGLTILDSQNNDGDVVQVRNASLTSGSSSLSHTHIGSLHSNLHACLQDFKGAEAGTQEGGAGSSRVSDEEILITRNISMHSVRYLHT